MSPIPDPHANARHFWRNLPAHALAMDDPWWWGVLALGADCINIHSECGHRGPLAIVSRPQKPWHRRRDVEALSAILKAAGRPMFDAYSCPKADGMIVGLVEVVDCVDDARADSLWFVGPYALKVEKQCMLPIGPSGSMMPGFGMLPISKSRQESIAYGLTALAANRLGPGVPRR